MFNNMKNKIREKTGSELPKFSANAGSLFNKTRSNQHSRQSSQGSINSNLSDFSVKGDNDKSKISNDDSKVEDKTTHLFSTTKFVDKEKEWRDKEKEYVTDLLKQTKELQEALALAEDNRKKLLCCQEEKEQLEMYQKQELLEKEEENNADNFALKEAQSIIEGLKQEMNRLRPLEEQVNNCQDDLECLRHTSEKERWNLTSQLAQKDEVIRHLEERITVLTHRTEADCQALGAQLSTDERVRSLVAERALLERRLEEAHIHLSEIKTSWSNKIAILETQVGRLSRQAGEEGTERRNAEKKICDLESKCDELNKQKENLEKKLEKLIKERDNLAAELKELSNVNECEKLEELTRLVEVLSKENEALRLSNEESRRIFDESLSKEIAKNNTLSIDLVRLKEYSAELRHALEEEKQIKDKTLFRNAEVSQLVQLTEQELKQQQAQNEELFKRISYLEEQLEITRQDWKKQQIELGNADTKNLIEKIKELENEIADKNKSIRILQQNLTDVKKTFQNELKSTANSNNNNGCDNADDQDINFKYMKHVLIKFLTSSEYEAQQLTKAVATLLKLNSDEERLIKDTLEWRSSWFGSKPRVKLHFNPS